MSDEVAQQPRNKKRKVYYCKIFLLNCTLFSFLFSTLHKPCLQDMRDNQLSFFHAPNRRGSRGGETGEFSPPFFWAPFFLFFFLSLKYWLVLIHYYKTSPPISKSWIRACLSEHLCSENSSHVFQHLQDSEECRNSCSVESSTILDSATTKFQVKIKEALYINWEKAALNQQIHHLN